MIRPFFVLLVIGLNGALSAAGQQDPSKSSPEDVRFFETHVRPVLADHCYRCHSSEKAKSDFRLDSLAGLLRGGKHGPAIVPGKSKESLLILAINHGEVIQMPPKKKLSAKMIADLTAWVDKGAPWPNAKPVPRPAPRKDAAKGPLFTDEEKSFWAFQRPTEPANPEVKDESWPVSPIDRFILAGLEKKGLAPAPPADRRTLLRRATYDLTGLPPTPEEIRAFVDDDTPDAFEKVVDRLLASPRYGERWGRHWLDVARYADSNGLDENMAYANAFRYRDYVIRAFNADKPYDRFVHEQLAGDLLPGKPGEPLSAKYERWIATGFLSVGPKMLADDDPRKKQMDIVDEQITTTSQAFLALTMGCGRCHDHKFDPLPTTDYYSLAAIFKSTHTMNTLGVVAEWHEHTVAGTEEQAAYEAHEKKIKAKEEDRKKRVRLANEDFLKRERARAEAYLEAASAVHHKNADAGKLAGERSLNVEILKQWVEVARDSEKKAAGWTARQKELFGRASATGGDAESKDREAVRKLLHDPKGPFRLPGKPERFYSKQAKADLKRLAKEKKDLEKSRPKLPRAMGVREGKIEDLRVHLRGNYLTLGEAVPRRFPRILTGEKQHPLDGKTSGRLKFARWLTRPDHPLTARVMANRIWRWHFGAGIVRTVDNFGRLGERPSHPELLDWLALRFVEDGWSIKAMHRRLMLSSTYRMSSAYDAKAAAADPENRLFWRFARRRLEAEEIRDSILAVSGRLDTTMYGQLLKDENRKYVSGTASKMATYDFNRRSVYLPVLRSAVYKVLQAFDFPDPAVMNGDRTTTTVAPQALLMMNSGLIEKNTRHWASELLAEKDLDAAGRIGRVYERALSRPPTDRESARIRKYLAEMKRAFEAKEIKDPEVRAWQSFCRALLASNEFMYLE